MSRITIEQKINKALNHIRPMLERDGGDVEFVSFNEKTGAVSLRLKGACAGCPAAHLTLKAVIEAHLKEVVPEVQEVFQVM